MSLIDVAYSSAKLTARYRQRAQEMGRAVLRAETHNARQLKAAAITLSSGPYTTAQIRALYPGNRGKGPYSMARPNPPAPPQILNAQSTGFGALRTMWQTRLTNTPDGTQVTLYNTSPHARYMLGTVKMIPRPILEAVTQATHADRRARLLDIQAKIRS